jgi:hypothetical protein
VKAPTQPEPDRTGAKTQGHVIIHHDRVPISDSLREMQGGDFAGGRPQPRASIPPEVFEPVRRQRRVVRSILGLRTGGGAEVRRAATGSMALVGSIKPSTDTDPGYSILPM